VSVWGGGSFEDLLDPRFLQPLYQPIVDIRATKVVAVEALARWPELEMTPDVAFARAIELGRLAELDQACRNQAIDTALAHGLSPRFGLFVNIEPSTITAAAAQDLVARTRGELQLVVEITERNIASRPSELLKALGELRQARCSIALDDVGAEPASLGFLPLIAPSVVKLDVSLVTKWPDEEQGAILAAVWAFAERTGARILAEGIETERHLHQALAFGATLGQGWYFGRAAPLEEFDEPDEVLLADVATPRTAVTPFACVEPSKVRVGTKGQLLGISHHIENQGVSLATPPILLSTFQGAENFTPDTAKRYSVLSRRCLMVGALGVGLAPEPVPGVRGVQLSADDALLGEWVVVVVGAHYVAALISKDLGDVDPVPDHERRFEFVVTHDYDTVLTAARSLLERLSPFG
jgi:EAL domain-containing protein (putative c-di-GMP-specific phosphodiesterase class I)